MHDLKNEREAGLEGFCLTRLGWEARRGEQGGAREREREIERDVHGSRGGR